MKQINVPVMGQYTDNSPLAQPENSTRKVVNGVYYKKINALKNEDGFAEEDLILAGETLCGVIVGKGLRFLFIQTNATDSIYKVQNGVRTLVKSGNFEFDPVYIVTGLVTSNSFNQTLVVFIDDINPIRIINIDIDNSLKQISDYDLFPNITIPNHTFNELEQGGNLNSGAYYCFIQYGNRDNTVSKWVNIGLPVFIVSSLLADFVHYKGNYPSIATTKQIQVNLTNVDTNYDFINFAFVSKIDNVVAGIFAGKQNISGSNLTYVFSGQNQGSISLEELVTNDGGYYGAKSIISVNKQLLASNPKKNVETGFFEEALKIKIRGVSRKINAKQPVGSSKLILYNNTFKTFCHGEVYAFFAVPILRDGSEGRAYHIPGNLLNGVNSLNASGTYYTDDAVIGLATGTVGTGTFVDPYTRYQPVLNTDPLYDDATLADIKYFQTRDTTKNWNTIDTETKSFDLGVWENENETYDANYPTLAGQQVRHFRFPTLKRSREEWGNTAEFGSSETDILGIELDFTFMIKSNISSNVVGIKIYFAKRDENSITQLGQSLLMYQGYDAGNEGAMGGLFRDQTFGGGGAGWQVDHGGNTLVARFHAFDMIKNIPNVAASYSRQELKLSKIVGYSKDNIRLVSGADYSSGANSQNLPPSNEIKKIIDYEYMPANSSNGRRDNTYGEAAYMAKFLNIDTLFLSSTGTNVGAGSLPNGDSSTTLTTFLSTFNVYRTNVYINFESTLNFISTGYVFSINDDGSGIYVFGGDCFATEYAFITYGRRGVLADDNVADEGIKTDYKVIVNSAANTGLRASGTTSYEYIPYIDNYSNPNQGDLDRQIDPNQAPYDRAYSSVADLLSAFVYNFDINNTFPYRILRFAENLDNSLEGDLKQYRPLDYYEIDKIYGEITCLKANRDRIYINTINTCLVTVGQETITTDAGAVSITGNNDIFRMPPKEILNDQFGRGGTQHKLSCLITAYGMISVDEEQKKVHLFTDTADPISDVGKRITFQNVLPFEYTNFNVPLVKDNPLYRYGVGYTIAYDLDFNRVILAKKDFRLKSGIGNINFNVNPIQLTRGQYVFLNNKIYKVLTTAEYNSGKYDITQVVEANGGNSFAAPIEFSNTDEYEDVSFTYSFSFDTKSWTSEHEWKPNLLLNGRQKLWSYKDDLYEHNRLFTNAGLPIAKGTYYGTIFNFKICVAFNIYKDDLKWFYKIGWFTESKSVSGKNYMFDTFNKLFAYNEYQATTEIDLITGVGYPTDNIGRLKNIWQFNKLRDATIDKVQAFVTNENIPVTTNLAERDLGFRDRMTGHYFVVCLEYQNKIIDNEGIDLYIYNIETEFNAPIKR